MIFNQDENLPKVVVNTNPNYETLNRLAEMIRYDNANKGFTVTIGNIEQKLLLVVSEICEAQDELRDGHDLNEVYYGDLNKPLGFPIEIADAIIRLLDICGAFGIDIERVIDEKLAYNRSRLPKHGRRF